MSDTGLTYRATASRGAVGKVFTSFFFLIFVGFGVVFTWLVAREALVAAKTWAWKPTDCQILTSQISDTDSHGKHTGNYYFRVTYRYSFNGRTFTSDQYERRASGTSDYSPAARLVEQYPAEAGALCYVNPAAPDEAVLKRGNLFFALFVLFPLIFVTVGVGGIYFTWKPRAAAGDARAPISEGANANQRWGVPFISLFGILGAVLFVVLFGRPAVEILEARNWPAVPCVIISGEVQSIRGNHGSTYRVNILYRYSVGGREYKSNQYGFMVGSSSGYQRKQAIVRQHPPGSQSVCYVNPDHPAEAVLNRGFTPDLWAGLIPLVFVVFAGCMLLVIRRTRQQTRAIVPTRPIYSSNTPAKVVPGLGNDLATDAKWLRPATAPWAKLLGAIAVAAFWNGIVSFFVADVFHGWRSGHGQWFLTIFMIPFVVIGLCIIGGVIYFFLALFNPLPHLKITPGAVRVAESLRIDWDLAGNVERLENLRFRLQGREEAVHGAGKNTSRRESVFLDLELTSITAKSAMHSGSCTVTIPPGEMHSFSAPSNKVIWVVRVEGKIPRWPDLKEEFPLTVWPPARRLRHDT